MAWGTATGSSSNTSEMDWSVVYLRRSQPLTGRAWTLPSHLLDSTYVDACGQRWTTFVLARVDVQPTSSAGIRLQVHAVPVAHLHRLCYILWTIVQIWNSPAVCQPCIWPMRRLSPGSACTAHAKKIKRQWGRASCAHVHVLRSHAEVYWLCA